MTETPILVVDDEKNVRLSLTRCLESEALKVDTAASGEEALQKLEDIPYATVLLDLKLPGLDGIEVLRRIRDRLPALPVIIISAVGTIDSAVEAMKLGAVDFVQKPFSPDEIRTVVTRALGGRALYPTQAGSDYPGLVDEARRQMAERRFSEVRHLVHRAISTNPRRPEAYNLLGALTESAEGDRIEAQRFYRAALDIDPGYTPARTNLERVAIRGGRGAVDLGVETEAPPAGSGRRE
jgi:DNA-binding response OmpR family regulator